MLKTLTTITHRQAFTLLEILVATGVLVILLGLMFSITNQTSKTWQRTVGNVEQFREARQAFESMTRRLSQATLNTYWDYDDIENPTRYERKSELRFISGPADDLLPGGRIYSGQATFFQAPLGLADDPTVDGLENLLNTWGYFLEFSDDSSIRPPIIPASVVPLRHRWRLFEFAEPANQLSIYQFTSGNSGYDERDWYQDSMGASDSSRPVRMLAENIILLVILPKLSIAEDPTESRLASDYLYDSTGTNADPAINPKNQLPPVLLVTMIAIDELSARRLDNGSAEPDFGIDIDGLFENAEDYEADLEAVETALAGKGINYRVFTTNVTINGAKWSTEQIN